MPYFELKVGDIRCLVLSDGDETIPPAELIGIFPESSAIQAAVEAWTGSMVFSLNCLLIETAGQRILVDTGMGAELDPNHKPQLIANLREAGITPDQITLVVLTHGHSDHIGGGVTDDGQLVYPNARYLMSQVDWDHWTGPAMRPTSEKRLLPLKDRIELVEANSLIAPGVSVIAASGHTPGHLGIMIESGGEKLVDFVDATHHPLQVIHPDWSPKFDTDPLQSANTRRALFEQAAREGYRVMAYHYGFPGIGTIHAEGDGLRFVPIGSGN